MITFPENFVWGAASAAYQVEGAAHVDGRGPSVWDMFSARPGKTWLGQTGNEACDHYRRFKDDVALMKRIGLKAYRFSIAWPRVFPEGTGALNERGLGFYEELVDVLLAAGIEPYITLFHWDYPLSLYHRGGWLNRDSADWYADYVTAVVRRLSDRVTNWITLNEPQCFIYLGHQTGVHAPGDHLPLPEVLRAGHHSLLAHGKGVQAIRANSKKQAFIGYAPVGVIRVPLTEETQDVEAARAATFGVRDQSLWNNVWWMDPLFLGHYPEAGLRAFGAAAPKVHADDFKIIQSPIDFLGLNIYTGDVVRAGENGEPEEVVKPVGYALTAHDWAVLPSVLYWGPRFLYERYKQPIMITENGLSSRDWVSLDGRVHDAQRIDFTQRYLRELQRASRHDVPVLGYMHWSIMDNYEWAEGYKHRFGMIYVDYPTQTRILKDSAYWYQRVIASNGAILNEGLAARGNGSSLGEAPPPPAE